MSRFVFLVFVFLGFSACAAPAAPPTPPVPASYTDEPACKVKSIRQSPTNFENAAVNNVSKLVAVTKPDEHNVYQVYVGPAGTGNLQCITCNAQSRRPRP